MPEEDIPGNPDRVRFWPERWEKAFNSTGTYPVEGATCPTSRKMLLPSSRFLRLAALVPAHHNTCATDVQDGAAMIQQGLPACTPQLLPLTMPSWDLEAASFSVASDADIHRGHGQSFSCGCPADERYVEPSTKVSSSVWGISLP